MKIEKRLLHICLFLLPLLLTAAGLTGCSYMAIPKADDVQAKPDSSNGNREAPVYNSAVIKGKVIRPEKNSAPLLVAAGRISNGNAEVTGYALLNTNSHFMLYVPEGRYYICTFTDTNGNGLFENDEFSGCHGSSQTPAELDIREGSLTKDIAIKTDRDNSPAGAFSLPPALTDSRTLIPQITYNGQILKVYSEIFSPENAQTGYWNPSSFMKSFGAHIYLTEEYNPRKIPLLFVHGTEGTPHNWLYVYMRLDRSRYQPWFFYYPSGIRLPLAAALLNEELRELHKKYGFSKMAVVAHSVGGLTARSFFNRHVNNTQNNFIKVFISFATPWSGFGMADVSQVITHKSIPVWVDLGAQSDFIRNTLDEKLPPGVRHYIFYGKKDILAAEKATDERALACAVQSYGYDCTHDSILSDRKVFAQFNTILEKELW